MRILRTVGIGIGSVAASLVLLAGIAFAEEGSVKNDASRVKPAAVRAELKERAMTVASTTKAQIKEIKQTAQERVKAVREEAQERVKAVREEAQERVKSTREKAEQRLSDIRDKKKQETARKLAARLENLNKTWTEHFAKLLDRYNAMVEKMQKRSDAAAANGRDVVAANGTIQAARDAIAVAQTAVAAQAAKTYTLDASSVPTETATTTSEGQGELTRALKASFQSLHKTLFTDLSALRDGPMKVARAAVQNALQTLGKVPDVDKGASASTGTSGN